VYKLVIHSENSSFNFYSLFKYMCASYGTRVSPWNKQCEQITAQRVLHLIILFLRCIQIFTKLLKWTPISVQNWWRPWSTLNLLICDLTVYWYLTAEVSHFVFLIVTSDNYFLYRISLNGVLHKLFIGAIAGKPDLVSERETILRTPPSANHI